MKLLNAIALSTSISALASSTFAGHGHEYIVSACDMTGENTANMSITTVRDYADNEAVRNAAQEAFEELMSGSTVEQHLTNDSEYVQNLVDIFTATTNELLESMDAEYIYFDFHHPREDQGGPVTQGCTP